MFKLSHISPRGGFTSSVCQPFLSLVFCHQFLWFTLTTLSKFHLYSMRYRTPRSLWKAAVADNKDADNYNSAWICFQSSRLQVYQKHRDTFISGLLEVNESKHALCVCVFVWVAAHVCMWICAVCLCVSVSKNEQKSSREKERESLCGEWIERER